MSSEAMQALDKLFHYHGYTSWHTCEDKQKEVWQALKTIRAALQPIDVVTMMKNAVDFSKEYFDSATIIGRGFVTVETMVPELIKHLNKQGHLRTPLETVDLDELKKLNNDNHSNIHSSVIDNNPEDPRVKYYNQALEDLKQHQGKVIK